MDEHVADGNTTGRDFDADAAPPPEVDSVVVGAGFGGMYALHKLRERGFTAVVFEAAADVGGTWY
jgi:cation diffusion facilitator CzcD-associated flavoprotein CzcO